jgi:preprotein translocase subunit SecF
MMADGHSGLATRLYRGQVSYDFIGRRRRWYIASGVVLLISVLSIAIQGLHPSIDFKGGAVFQFPRHGHSISDVHAAVSAAGVTPEVVTVTGSGSAARFRVETKALTQNSTVDKVKDVEVQLEKHIGVTEKEINVSTVGSTWGSQITKKAIYGLIIFLIAVTIYLSVRFEWRMAAAAIIALIHDLIITAGIYSLSGFEVSPSTVIALLTILGYSLYDTVVVFDKVRENIAGITGGSRMTLSQAANLAVNQTLVRSINTSIIALLPVVGLLVIGAGLLGAGSLKDLALALMIGLASGAYSSIFIATPLVADMKEREPAYRQLARRVAARQTAAATPAAAPAGSGGERAAAAPTATAVLEDEQPRPRQAGPGPRPGARPASQRRGGRPGGRGGKSRKRR